MRKIEIDWPTSAKGVNGPAHAQEEDWEDEGSRQNFERQLTTEKRAEGSNLWLKFIFFRFVFYFNLLYNKSREVFIFFVNNETQLVQERANYQTDHNFSISIPSTHV